MSLACRLTAKWLVAAYGLESKSLIAACKDDKSWMKPDTLEVPIFIHEYVTIFVSSFFIFSDSWFLDLGIFLI